MRVYLLDFLVPVARALDLGHAGLGGHHMRVAYIAGRLARSLGRTPLREKQVMLAGALHDLGAMGRWEEVDQEEYAATAWRLDAERGYLLLRDFHSFTKVAEMIRFQRLPWGDGKGRQEGGGKVVRDAHILHLALGVAWDIDPARPIYRQVNRICEAVRQGSGTRYDPALVTLFLQLADLESFWLDVSFPSIHRILGKSSSLAEEYLEEEELLEFATLLARAVDFRLPPGVGHAAAVARVALHLGRMISLSRDELFKLRLAALLHDVGNLAMDSAVLLKPEILTVDDFQVVRAHSYYTYRILERMVGLGEVVEWCAYHHERPDGEGYPFHLEGAAIPLGAKLLAAANTFCSLAESRAYRNGLPLEERRQVVAAMGREGSMDPFFANLILSRFDDLEQDRLEAVEEMEKVYEEFRQVTERMERGGEQVG